MNKNTILYSIAAVLFMADIFTLFCIMSHPFTAGGFFTLATLWLVTFYRLNESKIEKDYDRLIEHILARMDYELEMWEMRHETAKM